MLCFSSVTIKATAKLPFDSSMSHPPSKIPATDEVVLPSSLLRVSCDVDFFDPITSELRVVPAHERGDPMRSEGLVVVENPSGVEVPAGPRGSFPSAQLRGSPGLAPCRSSQGRKRSWTHVPDLEVTEL